MTTIVAVHGVGNYRAGHAPSTVAEHLADTWRAALIGGVHGPLASHVKITAAYYAHRLRPAGAQAGADSLEHLPDTAKDMIREWLDAIDPQAGTPQGRLTADIRRDIARFAKGRGLNRIAVQRFIAVCFGEVDRYLVPTGPHRQLARTDVANSIAAANRDGHTIVIAHSLGSVVTYETLHAYPNLNVDALITIGSPLAMPHGVYQRLQPPPEPRGQRPANTHHWTNIADIGDIIAIPPHGIPEAFDGVDADLHTEIHWAEFHLASNYLRTDTVAGVVRALTPPLTA